MACVYVCSNILYQILKLCLRYIVGSNFNNWQFFAYTDGSGYVEDGREIFDDDLVGDEDGKAPPKSKQES